MRPSLRMCESSSPVFSGRVGSGRVNCCWLTPAQSFLVPVSARLMTIFYCPTTLGVVKLSLYCVFSMYPIRNSAAMPATQMIVFMDFLTVSWLVPEWYILICHSHLVWNPFVVIFPSHSVLEACSYVFEIATLYNLRINHLKLLFHFFFISSVEQVPRVGKHLL
jgi:hypothetical protein